MGKQHIIELNGKRYDAVTGEIIHTVAVPKAQPARPAVPVKHRNIDGFARSISSGVKPPAKTQRSKTLMRGMVKKPVVNKVHAVSPVTAPAPAVQPAGALAPQTSNKKLAKAQTVPKSKLIKRFSEVTPVAAVQQAATLARAGSERLQAVVTSSTPVRPQPEEAVLAGADAHKQSPIKRPKRHVRLAKRLNISPTIVSGGALGLAVLLIGGFFTYQNMPNLNMKVAAARAGIHASLPGYSPAGFGLKGGISYKPGQVTIGYKSNSDDRAFTVTQQVSSWDSATLLADFVSVNHPNYQSVDTKGKTVYLYDQSNATWVDGGIWYKIEGDSKLNSDQLQNLANSL